VKLNKAISWLLKGLQQVLFPQLEECWQSPLTDKEQQLVSDPRKAVCHTDFLGTAPKGRAQSITRAIMWVFDIFLFREFSEGFSSFYHFV